MRWRWNGTRTLALALPCLTLLCLALSGCTFSFDAFQRFRIQRALARQDYPSALHLLRRPLENEPDSKRALVAARQGARIAHLEAKDYAQAVEFYKHIILRSTDAEERKSSQRFIAQIYFENLQDYDQAVSEYEKLLKLDHQPDEEFRFRLNLAKSHFQLNNLQQALSEIESILAQKITPEQTFEVRTLKANIFMAAKQHLEAATAWEKIMTDFPERSKKENVALNLIVCYEEVKNFAKAIEVLEGMRAGYPNPDFLDLRIQRLKERQENQPGARGWRK